MLASALDRHARPVLLKDMLVSALDRHARPVLLMDMLTQRS
jgi:hypothetical protein